jgi:signal transduction histidine kinase
MAYADRDRTQEVLSNLVDNAAKYGGESGPIAVQWTMWSEMDRAQDQLPHGPAVEVRVVDHGAGIAPEHRGRLFTRFGKLDQRQMRGGHVGTGLGLFICRKLVEAMGGAIWYEETPGGGSTFAVRLPATRDAHHSDTAS